LSETITHVGRITDQLQTEVMGIRMLPISNVFNKYPRMVRDLSHRANKQVNLVIRGEDTELDRSLIEAINDPLIHLLRNCIDHGIEAPDERLARGKPAAGALLLTARHEQGRIIITAEDDGGGIDVERVKAKAIERGLISEKEAAILSHDEAVELIFVSGLSTAKEITDISGRGVGLDIVRNNIERLNGAISVETHPGQGTLFQINLPLTLAIIPTLLVQVVKGIFAIPLVTVTETLRMRMSEIHTITGRPVIRLRDRVLPVLRLADVFDIHSSSGSKDGETSDYVYIVVVQAGKTQAGLVVDRLVGEQEVVVKSLSALLGDISGISGAAILGDGQVALILDIQGILKDATARQSA
jgi:two-component system chemotaxis sensor kinase CheA